MGTIIGTKMTTVTSDVSQQFRQWYGRSITEIHGLGTETTPATTRNNAVQMQELAVFHQQ